MHNAGWTRTILPVLAGIALTALLLASCCTSPPGPKENTALPQNSSGLPWKETRLTDLQGHGTFSIQDLAGRPVLIPVLSDECPSCVVLLVRQLDEIEREPGVQNGSIAVVALDLGLPDGPGFIASHHGQSGFTGYTAHAPVGMTLLILNDLGPFAMDTNQVPVILVCPGREGTLLPPGLKNAAVLTTTIAREC
jgi:hypothetical protein